MECSICDNKLDAVLLNDLLQILEDEPTSGRYNNSLTGDGLPEPPIFITPREKTKQSIIDLSLIKYIAKKGQRIAFHVGENQSCRVAMTVIQPSLFQKQWEERLERFKREYGEDLL